MIHKTGIIYASGDEIGENLLMRATTSGSYGSSPIETTFTFTGWDTYAQYNLANDEINWNDHVGEYITYRCWMSNDLQTTGTGTGIMLHFRYADSTYQQFGGGKGGAVSSYLAEGESGWIWLTVKIPDPTVRTNPTSIIRVQASIRHNSNNGVSTVRVKNGKVEFGTVATPWTMNENDWGFVGNNHGFIERFNGEHPMSVYEGHYEMDEIIEY